MFNAVRFNKASQQIISQIRGLILEGKLSPGDRLPSESALTDQFQVSKQTLRATERVENVRFECGDGFQTLEALVAAGERFGGVVLDPPKFARSRRAVAEALRAYHWLNRLAVTLLEPGGILATCSCSGHVGREDFLYMLVGVAQQTGREIQVLEQRGASPDHPISAACLESEYLKCFICRVV